MKTFMKICSISVVLLLSMAAAHGGERDERQQSRDQRTEQRQQERRNASERQVESEQAMPSSQQPADPARKAGRMTPEERRALRRQIDEANHDITVQKR